MRSLDFFASLNAYSFVIDCLPHGKFHLVQSSEMNCKVCQNLSVKNPSLSFFRFPSDYDRCRDWAKRCDILPIFDEYGPGKFYKSFRICSDHFDSKHVVFDGRKKKLLSSAVPKEFHRKEPLRGIRDHSKNTNPQPKSNSCFTLKPFRNLCRFCAEEGTKLTDIFSWKGKTLKLEEKIEVFPITVHKEDELPLRVCHKCIIQLTKFHEFINNCMRADIKLKKILSLYKHKIFGNGSTSQKRLRLADTKKISDGKPVLNQESTTTLATGQQEGKFLLLKEYKDPELRKTKYVCLRASVQHGQGPSRILRLHESEEYEGDRQEKENKNKNGYSGEDEVSGIQEDRSNEKSVQDKHLPNINQEEYEQLNTNKYTCRKCLKHFTSFEILQSHEKAHSLEPDEQGRFICQTCGKVFQNRYRLNEHNGVHTGECPYKCTVCNKRFHKRALLRQHSMIHESEKRFACSMCNLRSNRRGNMIQHLKNHYKKLQNQNSGDQTNEQAYLVTEEPSECKKKRLSTENSSAKSSVPAEEHPPMTESNNEDSQCPKFKFMCGLCGKQYLDLESLGAHFRIHTGENCKSSRGEMPLEVDQDHPDERAVESKKCITKTAGKRKGEERNFQCEECGVKFKRKDTLTIHFRIHTGERPYMCKICGFTFKQRGDCLKHERNHSREDDQIF